MKKIMASVFVMFSLSTSSFAQDVSSSFYDFSKKNTADDGLAPVVTVFNNSEKYSMEVEYYLCQDYTYCEKKLINTVTIPHAGIGNNYIQLTRLKDSNAHNMGWGVIKVTEKNSDGSNRLSVVYLKAADPKVMSPCSSDRGFITGNSSTTILDDQHGSDMLTCTNTSLSQNNQLS
ncbi:MAG: hypothetical protein A3F12_04370 [Gammaproteobacteria bacterium RIFCSPHIGHO2_12_FULL_38_14]|nr:MAG: hypothetical protein A3F12_04370 [Gammaproteobacteria bacterium RIFCSPHIGHO2_12_FULL_38_14]